MLTDVVVTARIMVEICLFALIGQGILAILPGVDREKNLFYLILKTIASPGWRLARWVSPRFVLDQHVGWIALLMLMVLWVALLVVKQIVMGMELDAVQQS